MSGYNSTYTATIQYHSSSKNFSVIVRQPYCEGRNTQVDTAKVPTVESAAAVIRRWAVDPARVTVLRAD